MRLLAKKGLLSYGYLMGMLWVSYRRHSKNLGNWSFIGLQMPYKRDITNSYSIEKRNRHKRNRPDERFLVYCYAVYSFCETFIAAEPRLVISLLVLEGYKSYLRGGCRFDLHEEL